jgi:hypothetical protein
MRHRGVRWDWENISGCMSGVINGVEGFGILGLETRLQYQTNSMRPSKAVPPVGIQVLGMFRLEWFIAEPRPVGKI